MGFGRELVSSLIRVPKPPAKITAFIGAPQTAVRLWRISKPEGYKQVKLDIQQKQSCVWQVWTSRVEGPQKSHYSLARSKRSRRSGLSTYPDASRHLGCRHKSTMTRQGRLQILNACFGASRPLGSGAPSHGSPLGLHPTQTGVAPTVRPKRGISQMTSVSRLGEITPPEKRRRDYVQRRSTRQTSRMSFIGI